MSDTAAHDHSNWKPKSNPWLIAVVVTLAAFMEVLDTTIVNVALPHISGTMSASYDEATWTLTSYLVANGIVLPLSAYFSKILGRKRYFLICIAAFTVCSFLCGIATNLGQLIIFRILQGFFGGGLQPSQQSIILDTFPPEQRGRAFSISAVAIVVAPVLGPTLGGWITDNFTWRWVFLLNVPVGVLTTIAVMQFVEDPPWEKKQSHKDVGIDGVGIGLIALGLGCLQVFLDRGEDDDWFHSNFIITFAVLAAVGIVGATFWLLYAKRPVVDLRVLKDRNFALGSAAIVGFASVLYGSAVLIPQLAQQQLGYTATLAGLVLSPGALLIVFLIPVVSKLMSYVQTRYLVGFGFFLMGVALLYSHRLVPNIDYRTLTMMRSAQSAAIGFLFVPVTTLAYLSLPKSMNNDASALFTMFRNVAGSIGISLATAMIRERTQANMAHMVEHLTPLNQPYNDAVQRIARTLMDTGQTMSQAMTAATGQMYKTLVSQATILAYLDVFAACAIFSFMFIPLTFFFSPVKAAGGAGGH
ncbi:DHA2 family efflux MFS transporter permease subunit [Caballeronia sp. LP006]|uniref:DHA2 family efflux MFS transporter permease subunit n=1 Tax=unclassified Caballeronia TaxID=2646786 RepID=UPI001FD595B5|nr:MULTISPECIES: DHA2 family efflux MFS transporter permease subunit [unclassified Caballeronia]MDR5774872.1 DHA2 family efflux MFS transporter permease subunit [Caballeronia sp. LZ002]MDR5799525.1 DHA2 family efflux MFS transporter permease subunit [Caballeronia sp. LZ001]MDR5827257.1 DHA2 family efflux MFS transporter permease subunit [Caballeronia sp. LP006]MDR5850308.1 DHA2 family efflux MFS transporter permease subunit [Caballeronia sp. LZ003]